MIKTLIKLKILKFVLIGGISAACAFKRYCDKKNEVKIKKNKIFTTQTIRNDVVIKYLMEIIL